MYELLDGLVRGSSKTEDINLNVTLWDHQLFSKDNKRLVVLLMFQALRRDESIQVTCHIAAPGQEFHQKRDTQTDGLHPLLATTCGWENAPRNIHYIGMLHLARGTGRRDTPTRHRALNSHGKKLSQLRYLGGVVGASYSRRPMNVK